MPQIQRATRGIRSGASTLQSLITTLTNAMIQNQSVTASDVNQLISAYNTWILHDHKSDDLRGRDTYGNVTVYGSNKWASDPTSSQAKTSGGSNFSTSGFVVAATNDINDTDVNTIIGLINAVRTHKHTIFDTTS